MADPAAGGESLEQDIGRGLHEDVVYEEYSHGDVVAPSSEVEPRDDVVLCGVIVESAGIAQVNPVEVV